MKIEILAIIAFSVLLFGCVGNNPNPTSSATTSPSNSINVQSSANPAGVASSPTTQGSFAIPTNTPSATATVLAAAAISSVDTSIDSEIVGIESSLNDLDALITADGLN